MSIDATKADKIQQISPLTVVPSGVTTAASQPERVSDTDIRSALVVLNAHLATQHTEPKMTVDYLSGLNVVTFTAKDTGTVIYQMPSMDAVRLARLIGEGADVQSLGLLEQIV